jgi:hypothetical protein
MHFSGFQKKNYKTPPPRHFFFRATVTFFFSRNGNIFFPLPLHEKKVDGGGIARKKWGGELFLEIIMKMQDFNKKIRALHGRHAKS